MAKYTGPKWRVSRALNYPVFGSEDYKRRQTKPGQHSKLARKGLTSYSIQFSEKQKLKKTYGLLEKQFVNLFTKASKDLANTGDKLMQLLEMRLDNVVYRSKLAKSRTQARQFVTHGHVTVNGKKIDIPSYEVKVGDEIRLIDKISQSDAFKGIIESLKTVQSPEIKWIEILNNGSKVKMVPSSDMLDKSINTQLIVEFYNR